MKLLDSGTLPRQLEQATRKWDAEHLENAAQDAAVPLVMCRTREEYQATEQYQHHVGTPLIHVEKIGDSEPEPLGPMERPLSGIRALGMVHVVAGPTVLRPTRRPGCRLPEPQHLGLGRGTKHLLAVRRGDSTKPTLMRASTAIASRFTNWSRKLTYSSRICVHTWRRHKATRQSF